MALWGVLLSGAAPAPPPPDPTATLALVIGVNQSLDPEVAPLRYADDDALELGALLEATGAQVLVLTTPDADTTRLRSAAVHRAQPPSERAVADAVEELSRKARAAEARGRPTRFILAYAGHGDIDALGRGYVSLADTRLYGQQIGEQLIQRVGAGSAHLLVDACQSFFLAHQRGPGGDRFPVAGFAALKENQALAGVGLFLSTSSAKESHEWDGFQSGVFSYEVRSGLAGAADADHDGAIRYRELAAFVEHANASIANKKYRPEVYVRAPHEDDRLVSLPAGPRIRIEPEVHGHYFLEDQDGIRLLDVHSGPGYEVQLLRPARGGPLFLVRVPAQEGAAPVEAQLPGGSVSALALSFHPPEASARGAAHRAFSQIFAWPFDAAVVAALPPIATTAPLALERPAISARTVAGLGLLGVAAAGLAASAALQLSAQAEREQLSDLDSQAAAHQVNESLARKQRWSALGLAGGLAAGAAGVLVLAWPTDQVTPGLAVSDGQASAWLRGRF